MLDVMRKRAASWVIKVLLGAIVLSFVFFFGYTQLSSPFMGPDPLAARVGEEGITQKAYYAAVNQTLEQFRKNLKQDELDPNIRSMIEGNVLSQLVEEKLRLQLIKSVGGDVPPEILAAAIKKNPNLSSDGLFNLELYQKNFRPYFRRQFGVDFEKVLKDDILSTRFQEIFATGIWSSPIEEQWLKSQKKLNLTLEKIEIPPKALANFIEISPDEVQKYINEHKKDLAESKGVSIELIAVQALQNQKAEKFAEDFSQKILEDWKSSKLTENHLKQYNIQTETVDEISFNNLYRIFAQQDVPYESAAAVLILGPEQRFVKKPIFINGNYYLIRFIKNDIPKDNNQGPPVTASSDFYTFFAQWLNSFRESIQIEQYMAIQR